MDNREQTAIELYGKEKVCEVKALVYMSDPDMVYAILQDQGDEEGMGVIEALYYE